LKRLKSGEIGGKIKERKGKERKGETRPGGCEMAGLGLMVGIVQNRGFGN